MAFDLATLCGCWCSRSRFVVQHHLYDADQTGWLGVARIAMGWPLTAVAALVTYLAIRARPACTMHAHAGRRPSEQAARPPSDTRERGATRCPLRADTDRPLIAVAVLASFVAFLDGSVVNLALPAIGRDFGGGLALQQWVVDGYLLTLGALILVAGAISDQFGRLTVLRMGLAVVRASPRCCARWRPPAGCWWPPGACRGSARRSWCPVRSAMINARFSGAAQARAIGTWTAWTGTGVRDRPAARRPAGRRTGLARGSSGSTSCRWPITLYLDHQAAAGRVRSGDRVGPHRFRRGGARTPSG